MLPVRWIFISMFYPSGGRVYNVTGEVNFYITVLSFRWASLQCYRGGGCLYPCFYPSGGRVNNVTGEIGVYIHVLSFRWAGLQCYRGGEYLYHCFILQVGEFTMLPRRWVFISMFYPSGGRDNNVIGKVDVYITVLSFRWAGLQCYR